MRPPIYLLTGLILSLGLGWTVAQDAKTRHVVLISIDGLRPEMYLDENWPAPMIQWMARNGAYARGVQSVFPTVTYPSHTTILTGALPEKHGIYYNTPFEPAGQTGRWYWEESLIQGRTLWDAVREAGLKSANVTWPATVDAPIDWNIAEYWSLTDEVNDVEALRSKTHPEGLLDEIEKEATGKLQQKDFGDDYMARDDHAGLMAAYLLEQYRPALMTVHLLAADHFQHENGRDANIVRRAVATVDRAIARIYEAAERSGILRETAFIITGDHGFIDIHTALAPNRWLVEENLMEAAANRGDWKATFHASGGSAFLHLRDPRDEATLIKVKQILENLSSKFHRLFEIIDEAQLRAIGTDPNVRLALSARPGITFTGSANGPVLRSSGGGTHGYFPTQPKMQTGFIGFGKGFRPGAVTDSMGLQDIAPLISELLGLNFEAPDGVLLKGLLEE